MAKKSDPPELIELTAKIKSVDGAMGKLQVIEDYIKTLDPVARQNLYAIANMGEAKINELRAAAKDKGNAPGAVLVEVAYVLNQLNKLK